MRAHAAECGAACGKAVPSNTPSSGSPASASHAAGTTPVKLSTSNSGQVAEIDEGNGFLGLLHRVHIVFGMRKKTLPLRQSCTKFTHGKRRTALRPSHSAHRERLPASVTLVAERFPATTVRPVAQAAARRAPPAKLPV